MDTWGLIIAVVGAVGALYFAKKNNVSASKFFWWLCGGGCGIAVGAWWAVSIVNSLLP